MCSSDLASTGAVARYTGVGSNVDDMRRQLNFRYSIDGDIRRDASSFRISVRLSDLERGTLLWSGAYDALHSSPLAIRDEITSLIAGALMVKVVDAEAVASTRRADPDKGAYDFVLRGRSLMSRLTRVSNSEARKAFERAIELDPRHSDAYVGLGRTDLSAVAMGWTAYPSEALDRAEALARKAIEIEESNPAGHVLLGRTHARRSQYDRALDAMRRAVSLNPSNPNSHAGLGDVLLWSGEPEAAIRSLETALTMDAGLSAEDMFKIGRAHV